jgi:hypothetical protein
MLRGTRWLPTCRSGGRVAGGGGVLDGWGEPFQRRRHGRLKGERMAGERRSAARAGSLAAQEEPLQNPQDVETR